MDVYLIMLTFPHEGMVCIHFRDIVLLQTTVSKFKLDPLEEVKIQTLGPRGVQRRQRFTSIANEKSFIQPIIVA